MQRAKNNLLVSFLISVSSLSNSDHSSSCGFSYLIRILDLGTFLEMSSVNVRVYKNALLPVRVDFLQNCVLLLIATGFCSNRKAPSWELLGLMSW
jgi:hypothetical protein